VYVKLDHAVTSGALAVWYLGAALNPLSLTLGLLTVAVFEAATFDRIFNHMVPVNEEGLVVSGPRGPRPIGLPFRTVEVRELLASSRLTPIAAALLEATHEHAERTFGLSVS
jgi:hypothetical protein